VSRPALFGRLGAAARVTVVSAPPGSGKTVLLRSWIAEADMAGRAAWVPVGRGERDPQRFWPAVVGALRETGPASALVRALTAAPDLDGWAIVERLLKDLAPLDERVWLVIDDLHELGSAEARQQLELLVMRAPAELRFALATRHDVRLGLHRLRLEGDLTEIRADDRERVVRLDEHRQDPHAQALREARHAPAGRSRRARPRAGPARALRTPVLTQPTANHSDQVTLVHPAETDAQK
jgi:LuxR family transcriptional regulator, maltose regulon positive regulatory protein